MEKNSQKSEIGPEYIKVKFSYIQNLFDKITRSKEKYNSLKSRHIQVVTKNNEDIQELTKEKTFLEKKLLAKDLEIKKLENKNQSDKQLIKALENKNLLLMSICEHATTTSTTTIEQSMEPMDINNGIDSESESLQSLINESFDNANRAQNSTNIPELNQVDVPTSEDMRTHQNIQIAIHCRPQLARRTPQHLCEKCGLIHALQYDLESELKEQEVIEVSDSEKEAEDEMLEKRIQIKSNRICGICQKKLKTAAGRLKHERYVHNYHQCTICKLTCKTIECFRRHLIKAHGYSGPKLTYSNSAYFRFPVEPENSRFSVATGPTAPEPDILHNAPRLGTSVNVINRTRACPALNVRLSLNPIVLLPRLPSINGIKSEWKASMAVQNQKDISLLERKECLQNVSSETTDSKEMKNLLKPIKIENTEYTYRLRTKYGCPICSIIFVSIIRCMEHNENTHSSGNELTFECHICGNSYKSEESVQRHKRRVHHIFVRPNPKQNLYRKPFLTKGFSG